MEITEGTPPFLHYLLHIHLQFICVTQTVLTPLKSTPPIVQIVGLMRFNHEI